MPLILVLLLLISPGLHAEDTQLRELLTKIDERLAKERIEVRAADFRWEQWERFESELNFVVAHDPVSEVSDVPTELHSENLNSRLLARWEDLTLSAHSMQLTDNNPVWTELAASMTKFFNHRDQQLYRLARAQMKSGEIRESLEELYQQAAEKALARMPQTQTDLKVIDPVLVDLVAELKKITTSLSPTPTPSALTPLPWVLTAVFAAAFIVVLGKRRRTQPTVPIPVSTAAVKPVHSTEAWMEQLEATLQKQQNLEVEQERELQEAREYVRELKAVIKSIQSAKEVDDFYLQLEKLGIVTEAIEKFVARQDPLRYAEVPYVMTKLILSLSDRVTAVSESELVRSNHA